jgi:hypothetical protein
MISKRIVVMSIGMLGLLNIGLSADMNLSHFEITLFRGGAGLKLKDISEVTLNPTYKICSVNIAPLLAFEVIDHVNILAGFGFQLGPAIEAFGDIGIGYEIAVHPRFSIEPIAVIHMGIWGVTNTHFLFGGEALSRFNFILNDRVKIFAEAGVNALFINNAAIEIPINIGISLKI